MIISYVLGQSQLPSIMRQDGLLVFVGHYELVVMQS